MVHRTERRDAPHWPARTSFYLVRGHEVCHALAGHLPLSSQHDAATADTTLGAGFLAGLVLNRLTPPVMPLSVHPQAQAFARRWARGRRGRGLAKPSARPIRSSRSRALCPAMRTLRSRAKAGTSVRELEDTTSTQPATYDFPCRGQSRRVRLRAGKPASDRLK